jgi:hypothetical protein
MRALPPLMLIALLAAAPLSAKKADPEAELAKLLAGRTAGEPIDCIPLFQSNRSQTIDRTAIIYERGNTMYVNRFIGGCTQLDRTTIPVTRTTSSRLCRGDAAQIVNNMQPSMMMGACIFDKFTPYTKAK